jgi:hypothetical protein
MRRLWRLLICFLLTLVTLNLMLMVRSQARGSSAAHMPTRLAAAAARPPSPSANMTLHKLALASRRSQCKSDAVKSLQHKPRVPLLACEPRARLERAFVTEGGRLPISRFNLRLLPQSSKLSDAGFGDRSTCAVVGASGSVLAARHGALIDAHKHVIRINKVRTAGFEDHVGSKTTVTLFWGHQAHLSAFDMRQASLPPTERGLGLVAPAKPKDFEFFFEAAANRTQRQTALRPLLLLEPKVYSKAVAHLCQVAHCRSKSKK